MSAEPEDQGAVHPLARRFLFLDTPSFKARVLVFLGVLTLVLGIADFAVHRHAYFAFERFPGFFVLFGFSAFAFVVLSGWPLRRLLGRPENYYGGEDDA